MPGNLFLNWLLLHNRQVSLEALEQECPGTRNQPVRRKDYGWGCRLIGVHGKLHLWPCVKDCSVRFRGYSDRGFSALAFAYACVEDEASRFNLFASQDEHPNCGYDPAEDYRKPGEGSESSRECLPSATSQSK